MLEAGYVSAIGDNALALFGGSAISIHTLLWLKNRRFSLQSLADSIRPSIDMELSARAAAFDDILPWRNMYRLERSCQIIHDSIHRRFGGHKNTFSSLAR